MAATSVVATRTFMRRTDSSLTMAWRSLRRRPLVWGALATGVLIVLVGTVAPLVAPFSPDQQDIANRLQPPLSRNGAGRLHVLGTDALGRDLWSRIAFGARLTIPISLFAVAIAAVIGGLLGGVATFRGGWIEVVIMRIADVQLAFPSILLSLAIVAIFGASLRNLVFVLSLSGWVLYARLSRSQVVSLKRLDFIEAARALGAGDAHVLRWHVIPNVIPTIMVVGAYSLGGTVTAESALSFLGLGIQPPGFTSGGMLSDGTSYMMVAWWLAAFPGLAIMLTVFSATAVGEWLRDYFDPRLRME